MRLRLALDCGSARKGLALDRFEPCEGKLSRTVLKGRGQVNRLRLPGGIMALRTFQTVIAPILVSLFSWVVRTSHRRP